MSKKRIAVSLSPLSLLALTACVNSDTSIIQLADGSFVSTRGSTEGHAYKGLLSNALVYIDYDDAALGNSATVRTAVDGSYTLATLNNNYTIVVVTDGDTIDGSTNSVLSGVTLKAPSGATVVTATTTLMEEGNLTAAQVNDVLGLGAHINPLTFNTFTGRLNKNL